MCSCVVKKGTNVTFSMQDREEMEIARNNIQLPTMWQQIHSRMAQIKRREVIKIEICNSFKGTHSDALRHEAKAHQTAFLF